MNCDQRRWSSCRLAVVNNSFKESVDKGIEEIKDALSCINSFDNLCGKNKDNNRLVIMSLDLRSQVR